MRAIFSTVSQLLANTLYQRCEAGASLNANFDCPTTGYMVSVRSGPVYPDKLAVNPIEVARFIRGHLPNFDSSTYAGVWTDSKTGKIYFDISINMESEEEAMNLAKQLKELSIWDVVNKCEIRVN